MYRMNRWILPIFLFSMVLTTACGENGERERTESETETRTLDYIAAVDFLDSRGESVVSVDVAVADDDHSRSEGLMDVKELPENAGMLFIFEDEAERSFWMANTPLSLDIIFVNEQMEIIRIHRNTVPYSHENVVSEGPAMYVVEVNSGFTLRHDITEGMSIVIEQ
jgi:uncharacterized protein